MASKNRKASTSSLQIGAVFTPTQWGEFAVREFGIFDDWIKGASVFDPTMGTGDLLCALISLGIKKGYSIEELPISTIYGNELNSIFYQRAIQRFMDDFGVDMQPNFTNEDILTLPIKKFDILLGNPPWANFTELPTEYKEQIKQHFFAYDLVDRGNNLLLGGSRIDIAALVIQRTIQDFLQPHGNAYFYLPLSILLNDGAHRQFRTYSIHTTTFAPKRIYDFHGTAIFENVATRYGLVHFKRDETPHFPIDYRLLENSKWLSHFASPLLSPTDPLSILAADEVSPLAGFEAIELPKTAMPRQGINTGGANSIFIFTSYLELDDTTCLVNGSIELPRKYVHPLLVGKNFNQNELLPEKWVLLPYSLNGKVLSSEEMKSEPLLSSYFSLCKKQLTARKGSMIGSAIKRGVWWSLLGVGPYNYAPHKIVWEAYGKSTFRPQLIAGNWQVNQSLQAYIPVENKTEAERILAAFKNPAIEVYLLSLKMEGTMNWAQPGKIKKLIRFID